jgi:nitroimidazol reductase NimA-like FMN-containing flavoprotein (pyridoxamine 5'-phosphate oxidase superfamily)
MRLVDSRTGIEWLDRDECLRLLAESEVGRLAVIEGGVPMIFPVNYHLDGEAIVFRTGPGTKLEHGLRAPACFEIDEFEPEHRRGWSVVGVGRLREVTHYDGKTLERVKALPLDPWAPGDKPHWMRLAFAELTGRRVGRFE